MMALDLKGLSPEEKKAYRCKLAAEEILATEKEYISDLGILIEVRLDTFSPSSPNELMSSFLGFLASFETKSRR